MGYDDLRYDRKDNLEKWRRAARGGITICQYYTDNFAEPWVMSPFTVALEGDRRYFRQNRIDSVYLLMWPRGYWWNHGLNAYLAGRCFYDFALNPQDLLRDYARNYFGPEAGPLLADYFVVCTSQSTRQTQRKEKRVPVEEPATHQMPFN